jgi:hypothetical protein
MKSRFAIMGLQDRVVAGVARTLGAGALSKTTSVPSARRRTERDPTMPATEHKATVASVTTGR